MNTRIDGAGRFFPRSYIMSNTQSLTPYLFLQDGASLGLLPELLHGTPDDFWSIGLGGDSVLGVNRIDLDGAEQLWQPRLNIQSQEAHLTTPARGVGLAFKEADSWALSNHVQAQNEYSNQRLSMHKMQWRLWSEEEDSTTAN
jgi:hypothetical protein